MASSESKHSDLWLYYSLAEAATRQQAQALMTVTQHGHGGTPSRAPMAANGMPFVTGIGCATVVHVGTILVVIQPTRLGYTDGERMPGLDVLMLGQRRQM